MTGRLGVVTRVDGPTSWVLADGVLRRCALKGTFKDLKAVTVNPVAVGDRVRFEPDGEDGGCIAGVEPRVTRLSRARGYGGGEQVVVANVDLLLVVVSWVEPAFNPRLLDRFLVAGAKGGLGVAVCINKSDLADAEAIEEVAGIYRDVGYTVLLTSARTGEGVSELRALLAGNITVLAGPSGAGKSTLLNELEPGLGLKVRATSRATGKGRHTTTWVSLHPLSGGGFVADTPGIREYALWRVAREELGRLYAEFVQRSGGCRYYNCLHHGEPECGVMEAVEAGRIHPLRYDAYLQILASLEGAEATGEGDDDAAPSPGGRRRLPAHRRKREPPGRRRSYHRGRDTKAEEDDATADGVVP